MALQDFDSLADLPGMYVRMCVFIAFVLPDLLMHVFGCSIVRFGR